MKKATNALKVAPLIIAKDRGEVNVERLPAENPLLKEIFLFYVDEWKRAHPGDKNPREWFYVSDVGKCPRAIYYQFHHPEMKRDMAVSTIMTFTFGNLFHEEMQRVLRGLGYTTARDIEFGTWSKIGFMKRGRIDALITERGIVPVMWVVTEIKSKNPYAFEEGPSQDEIDQTLSYMEDCKNDPYFRSRKKEIAGYGFIIYMDRSGLAEYPVAIFKLYYSEKRIQAIKKEFRALHRAIKNMICPLRPFIRDSIDCSYCRFKDFCWSDVPLPPEPEIPKDETIMPPSMEIVQSTAAAFLRLKNEISMKKKDLDLAEKVLEQYFKGSGVRTIDIGGVPLNYEVYNDPELDIDFLIKHLRARQWYLFAKPSVTMLREAVKAGIIDGGTFEHAFKYVVKARIKVGKPKKGENDANRKT